MGHHVYKDAFCWGIIRHNDATIQYSGQICHCDFSRKKEQGHWSSSPRKVWKVGKD